MKYLIYLTLAAMKTKQKLYASFGKIYAIDLQDLHNKYELAKKQSSMVVEIDDVAVKASALYTSILDFQTALYTKPTKNIKNCKKLFNILYSQKDNMFDEYDIINKLLQLGPSVTVISPDKIIDKLIEKVSKAYKNY